LKLFAPDGQGSLMQIKAVSG